MRLKCSRRILPKKQIYVLASVLGVLTTVAFLGWNSTQEASFLSTVEVFQRQIHDIGLTQQERDLFKTLLKAFTEISQRRNAPYFLYHGTLLGYVRNGDVIPWDDDVDLAVHEEDFEVIKAQIRQTANYSADMTHLVIKFFSDTSFTSTVRKGLKWPFMDIVPLHRGANETLRDATYNLDFKVAQKEGIESIPEKWREIQESDVYPLRSARFLGQDVHIPNKPDEVLKVLYGEDAIRTCQSASDYHRRLKQIKVKVRIDCKGLGKLYEGLRHHSLKGQDYGGAGSVMPKM